MEKSTSIPIDDDVEKKPEKTEKTEKPEKPAETTSIPIDDDVEKKPEKTEKPEKPAETTSIPIDDDVEKKPEKTEKTEKPEKPAETKRTTDDVYCHALAKTLDNTECPMTVGLFAPWGRGKDILLKKIEDNLCNKTSSANNKRSILEFFQPIIHFVKLIFHMIFYHPNPTQKQRKSWKNHYIFVRFSAWEYAGSDHVWTGLITNLCEHIENEFGILPISIYRALDGNNTIKYEDKEEEKENEEGKEEEKENEEGKKEGKEEKEGKEKKKEKEKNESLWINKVFMGFPLWHFTLLVILFAVTALVLFLIVGFQFVDPLQTFTSIVEGVGFTILGISLKLPIIRMYEILKNSIFTQKVKIQRKLDRTDMSSKLEFINDVKKEVEVIINYLQFIETFKKVKIRVVIEITKLDICMPNKVVGVLNAMNILLSDPKAPFISILAADPGVIVQCVEKSDELKGMADNGYQYLNRVVVLPFYIPKMDDDTKYGFLKQMKEPNKEAKKISEQENQIPSQTTHKGERYDRVLSGEKSESSLAEDKVEGLIREAEGIICKLTKFIDDNVIHMRRIVNTVSINIRLIFNDESLKDIQNVEKVVKWVLLTTLWPCRMSWIIQVVEDENQKFKCKNDTKSNKDEALWDVFATFLEPLDNMKACLKNLLEMDGDPELFQQLLCDKCDNCYKCEKSNKCDKCDKFDKCDKCEKSNKCDKSDKPVLTFADASNFIPVTVNLDHSMKRQMELLLGSYNLLKFKRNETLTPFSLLKMNTGDVCNKVMEIFLEEYKEEIKGLGKDEQKAEKDHRKKEIAEYLERIRKNKLNGRAIVCSDNNALCKALDMKMGDWTTFCLYFLNLPTPKIGYS